MLDPQQPTLLITVAGRERSGLRAALFREVARHNAVVLDIEQLVVRGSMTLSFLLTDLDADAEDHLTGRFIDLCRDIGLQVHTVRGYGDQVGDDPARAIVTVLADPLRAEHVAHVTSVFTRLGVHAYHIRRLSTSPTTIQFYLSGQGTSVEALRPALARLGAREGFDVSVSPAGLRRYGRRLVVMDVDSTLIQDEVIELLAAHAGREKEVAAVTERAMRGELDFAQSLHERVRALAGLPESVIGEVSRQLRLTPGADTLIRTLHSLGFTTALVSGGFLEVIRPLADKLGITRVQANQLEVVDGVLTGNVLGAVVDRAAKADALRRLAAEEGLPLDRTVAIGDGANDLDMLALAGLGIAFNAKPAVRAAASTTLNVPNLDAVLSLLDISRADIEEAEAEEAEAEQAP
ncbi:phosphoserine phosphatase SerB [Nigerium massiliense]|uniref:phosphoserine phosphatase SerB n=1 Tax=Nigerium massiliense TaxID=1522317 RepID=UPI00059075CD|nr:phosphoserine phosphatase SerB [Nigerium massiliense]